MGRIRSKDRTYVPTNRVNPEQFSLVTRSSRRTDNKRDHKDVTQKPAGENSDSVIASKRPRGRPRKDVTPDEPTVQPIVKEELDLDDPNLTPEREEELPDLEHQMQVQSPHHSGPASNDAMSSPGSDWLGFEKSEDLASLINGDFEVHDRSVSRVQVRGQGARSVDANGTEDITVDHSIEENWEDPGTSTSAGSTGPAQNQEANNIEPLQQDVVLEHFHEHHMRKKDLLMCIECFKTSPRAKSFEVVFTHQIRPKGTRKPQTCWLCEETVGVALPVEQCDCCQFTAGLYGGVSKVNTIMTSVAKPPPSPSHLSNNMVRDNTNINSTNIHKKTYKHTNRK